MNKYTVIGFYMESGLSFIDKVEASSTHGAFLVVAKNRPDSTLISVVAGHLDSGKNIVLAGNCVAEAKCIIDEPQCYGGEESLLPHKAPIIADFNMRDWRLVAGDSLNGISIDQTDIYRVLIEQDVNLNRVFFKVYSTTFDDVRLTEPLNGLSGVIEVRNGKPAISLGLEENNLPLHIESDIISGLYVHSDNNIDVSNREFFSTSHRIPFESTHYELAESSWIMAARSEIANSLFESAELSEGNLIDTGSWFCDDTDWALSFYVEGDSDGESKRYEYRVKFANESTIVI